MLRSVPVVVTAEPTGAGSWPFALQLPADYPPTWSGKLLRFEWHLEARAVVAFGRDVVVPARLVVHASDPDPAAAKRRLEVAPLGSERRNLVWASVGATLGLEVAGESLTGHRGAVAVRVGLELLHDRLHLVATLAWPRAGLALELTDRRWTDVFGETSRALDDASFDTRFMLRGRDPAQLRGLLTAPVRAHLQGFAEVRLDDTGARLSSPGNGTTSEELEAFVRQALQAADALNEALAAVPCPASLEPHRAAWTALAQRLGGVFCPGDFSLRQARYRDGVVELVTCFDDAGLPSHTLALVPLSAPPGPASEEAQRVFASVAAECEGVVLGKNALEARLPSPLAEPQRAESVWRALQRLARVVR